MRKKIFAVIGIAAFAAVVAFNINAELRSNFLTDVNLDNLESLSNGETISPGGRKYQTMEHCNSYGPIKLTCTYDYKANLCTVDNCN